MTATEPPAVVRAAILPGETVQWWGAPPQGFFLRVHDIWMIPLSLLGCGIAAAFLLQAPSDAPRDGQVVLGAAALWALVARFWYDAYVRSHMAYAVTGRAAYVILAAPFSKVQRFSDVSLSATTFEAGTRGRGTLRLGPAPAVLSLQWRQLPAYVSPVTAFESIDDARNVYRLIMAAAASS